MKMRVLGAQQEEPRSSFARVSAILSQQLAAACRSSGRASAGCGQSASACRRSAAGPRTGSPSGVKASRSALVEPIDASLPRYKGANTWMSRIGSTPSAGAGASLTERDDLLRAAHRIAALDEEQVAAHPSRAGSGRGTAAIACAPGDDHVPAAWREDVREPGVGTSRRASSANGLPPQPAQLGRAPKRRRWSRADGAKSSVDEQARGWPSRTRRRSADRMTEDHHRRGSGPRRIHRAPRGRVRAQPRSHRHTDRPRPVGDKRITRDALGLRRRADRPDARRLPGARAAADQG